MQRGRLAVCVNFTGAEGKNSEHIQQLGKHQIGRVPGRHENCSETVWER